jgi:NAD+ synthase (glutamine-hydrolysing)
MKISLAQMRVIPGDPTRNFETMQDFIRKAVKAKCRIIAFPEMCIGGYLLGDRWTSDEWCNHLMSFNPKLQELSKDIAIIYGNVYVNPNFKNKDGRSRKYNAGYVFVDGKPAERWGPLPEGITIKSLLPNYRIFDDERYFYSLQEQAAHWNLPIKQILQPFFIDSEKVGVEICEDLWFNDYFYHDRPLNVSHYLIQNGAQYIFNLSASPWTHGKDQARNNCIKKSFQDCKNFVPFFYVNCVGTQNNGKNIVVFDGDSTIYNEKAEVIQTAIIPYGEELIINDDLKSPSFVKQVYSKIEGKYNAIIEGIQGMDTIMGNSQFPYIIGLSGGIDSAVVACLLSKAVGSKRIIACNLPSKYNSYETKTIASDIAIALNLEYHEIPIEEITKLNADLLYKVQPAAWPSVSHENIQAKIRGTSILSNIAGIHNGIMTCNGNKVEIALGYATLYGDVNGAIAPIGDLLKTEVFEMARFLNEQIFRDQIIPDSLIPSNLFEFSVPPSAELTTNQIDPMKWGYHDALVQAFTDYKKIGPETICEWYLEKSLCRHLEISEELFKKYELDKPEVFIKDLEWFTFLMERAVFKRIQSPPIIILSKGSFGYDIRESQLPVMRTDRYMELRKNILEQKVIKI